MRVAYVCADPGIAVFGTKGASVHVQEIVRAFRERGDTVTVYCTRRGDAIPVDLCDLPVIESRAKAENAADREVAIANAAATLAQAAIADGCDLVYERYSLFSTAAASIRDALGVPTVLEVNSPLIEEQRQHRVLVDEAGARAATAVAIDSADVVACVSQPVADWAARFRTRQPDRVIVAANGVNTRRIRPATPSAPADLAAAATPSAEDDGCLTVGFVGTLKPWHGVDALIRATALAGGRWRVLIVGDGPERDAVQHLAETLGVDVEFTGAVAPAGIPHQLARFDVAVAPYPAAGADQYFSPLKLYEYLAAGLPIVASRIGQIPSVIDHGRTGLLVEAGDDRALADALLRLRDDASLRRLLGVAARELAVRDHDWVTVLRGILHPLGLHGEAPEHLSARNDLTMQGGARR
ncbi:glycosyltransferase family 4 protein [Marisediminicola senii]|uniref:glycosyltransferase family 4 protein n=1 Tax=Marisediminicola senii TaxID=2711233 RepID=UPI0013EAEDD3|nr:glycosyltransferase family 4 protein [Marisediminicola senii]